LLKLQKPRYVRATIALLAGCIVNYLGDLALGVNIELYWGLETFNFLWFLDIFVVPLIAGIVVGLVFGLGGKWLCYFPPLIVRLLSYYYFLYIGPIPEGASLIPMGWWGFFVILVIESAAFGGVAGEILIKKTYGRLPRELVYKSKDDGQSSSNTSS